MQKPYLLVVTGRPGSGKTTFAKTLGSEFCMPVISRDEMKEGYVHTLGKSHAELPPETNRIATDIFFDTLMGLIDHHVSVIAEAAFQHAIWSYMLEHFQEKARIYLLICKLDEKIALNRYINRGLGSPLREYFHGDDGVNMAKNGIRPNVSPYEEPRFDAPTFYIDTFGEYRPSVRELGKIILDRLL